MSEITKGKEAVAIPSNLRGRPIHNGYVVPYFVSWYKGDQQVNENEPGARPSFPTTDYGRLMTCRKYSKCWICGNKLGAFKAFVFGPASALSRASYEPPSHRDCARYAAQVCPFLSNENVQHVTERAKPYHMKQGERKIDEVAPYNPGITIIWITRTWSFRMQDRARGIGVFEIGDPESVEFYREGRNASYKEVADGVNNSIEKNGMIDPNNQRGMRELAWRVQQLMEWAVDK